MRGAASDSSSSGDQSNLLGASGGNDQALEHASPIISYRYVPTRTVVVALDETENSSYALRWTIENILQQGRDLAVLIHCRTPYTAPSPYASFGDPEQYTAEMQERERSHSLLKKYAMDVKLSGFAVKAISIRGECRTEIVRKVAELKADMVIVGSRDRSKIRRVLHGSTDDYLSHHLHVPLMIVKQPWKTGKRSGHRRAFSN
ncbi:MAG: hypothetical protein DHS80DRAFT_14681 [Piptocephalis tieghemiana]|nr:MAG: hypothetical protein DHS80DRAFT_14681 [Piptocephalis tieghemiana]